MSEKNPLGAVIREVPPKTKDNSGSALIVKFNAKFKQIEKEGSVWKTLKNKFTGNIKTFRVANIQDDRRNFARGESPPVYIDDFKNSRKIGIKTTYKVSCNKGDEDKAVKALWDDIHPGVALNNNIKKWIHEHIYEREAHFIDHYSTEREVLEKHLKEKALAEAGLNLQVNLVLVGPGELSLAPHHIKEKFPVIASDYNEEEQFIDAIVELIPDEKNRINAILAMERLKKLNQLVVKEIKKYIAQQLTLQDIYFRLREPSLKSKLKDHLDSILKKEGRKVDRLSLECQTDLTGIQLFIQKEDVDIPCRITGYPEPVTIKNKLQMELQNVVSYKRRRSPEIDSWVTRNLEQVIPKALFGVKYIDLLINFSTPKKTIIEDMKKRAHRIGYHIKQLITVPDLEPLQLLKPFSIIIDGEETFSTNNSRHKVKLGLHIRTKIKNLEDIKDHLNRQADVKGEMKDAVLDEMAHYLRSVDPKHFYVHFHSSDDRKKPSVTYQLNKSIRKRLEQDFKAEIEKLDFQMVDTDVTRRFDELMGRLCPFQVKVDLLSFPESISVRGKFKVNTIVSDKWDIFLSRIYSLQEIKEIVEEHLSYKFRSISVEELKYYRLEKADQIKKIIDRWINIYAIEHFGLTIEITDFARDRTQEEDILAAEGHAVFEADSNHRKGLHEKALAEDMQQVEDQVALKRKIHEKRLEVITDIENIDELEELDNKEVIINKRLGKGLSSVKHSKEKPSIPETGGSNFDDIAKTLPALPGKNSPGNDSEKNDDSSTEVHQ